MLCIPIKSKDGGVAGVLQAINKMGTQSDSDLFFNIEDEGVCQVLAQILTNILHNSLMQKDRELFYQDLLHILEIGSKLNSKRDLKSFMIGAKALMKDLFNVRDLRVYVYNPDLMLLKFFDEDNDRFDVQAGNFGIASEVLSTKMIMHAPCASNHPFYNGRF